MDNKVIDTVIKALEGEYTAIASFFALSQASTNVAESYSFLGYAKQEMEHALLLLDYLNEHASDVELGSKLGFVPEITDKISFIIEYLAEEEAGIFYYETLTSLALHEEEKKLFQNIGHEEKEHMRFLQEILGKKH